MFKGFEVTSSKAAHLDDVANEEELFRLTKAVLLKGSAKRTFVKVVTEDNPEAIAIACLYDGHEQADLDLSFMAGDAIKFILMGDKNAIVHLSGVLDPTPGLLDRMDCSGSEGEEKDIEKVSANSYDSSDETDDTKRKYDPKGPSSSSDSSVEDEAVYDKKLLDKQKDIQKIAQQLAIGADENDSDSDESKEETEDSSSEDGAAEGGSSNDKEFSEDDSNDEQSGSGGEDSGSESDESEEKEAEVKAAKHKHSGNGKVDKNPKKRVESSSPTSSDAASPPKKAKKGDSSSKSPEDKYLEDMVSYLKANGRTPLTSLGSKVKKPMKLTEKLGRFVKSRPEVFKLAKGDVVELVQK